MMRSATAILASAVLLGCTEPSSAPFEAREDNVRAVARPAADSGAQVVMPDAGADQPEDAATRPRNAPDASTADSGTTPRRRPPAPDPSDDDDAGASPSTSTSEPANFSTTEPLEVAIEISEADWEVLRFEGRSMPATISGCPDPTFTSYTKFKAKLELLGQTLPDVELRKKGYLGSISIHRPSFSIDFGEQAGEDRIVSGFKRLTLNNNLEDKSNAHQCLSYALFEKAGLPAPRCGLARVTVNGVDKGFFTNVEPIKKPFLRRVFGEDSGNLYELQAPSDFIAAHADRIELKNDGQTDRSDLMRLIDALTVPDAELIAALDPLIDLEEYITFWALESLLGQWDGLSGHGTNAYLYHSARDNRFHAIPWGNDHAFVSTRALFGDEGTVSVLASTQLSKRLWALPDWRAKYQERLRMLLSTLWKPDELITQLHAIAQVTQANESAVAATERFISEQRKLVEAELDRPEPPTPRVVSIWGSCMPPRPASAGVYGQWDATPRNTDNVLDQLALITSARPVPEDLMVNLSVHERAIMPGSGPKLGAAGMNEQGTAYLGLTFVDEASRNTMLLGIVMPVDNYQVGEIRFHGYETFGVLAELTQSGSRILGFIGQGSIKLDMAGRETGDIAQGSWNAQLAGQLDAP